jgi:hypothetical protein
MSNPRLLAIAKCNIASFILYTPWRELFSHCPPHAIIFLRKMSYCSCPLLSKWAHFLPTDFLARAPSMKRWIQFHEIYTSSYVPINMYRIAWSAKLKKKIKINTPTEKKTMILDIKKKKKPLIKVPCTPKSSWICQPLSADHRSNHFYKAPDKSQYKSTRSIFVSNFVKINWITSFINLISS